MNLENQFNDYLTYQEAVKEALIPGYKSDWPDEIESESDDSSDDSSDDDSDDDSDDESNLTEDVYKDQDLSDNPE